MILVKQLQNFALYLYFFFVNFQELSFFGLNNFSIPKFTILIYLGTIAIQHRHYIRISNLKKIMRPILAFFGLLIIVNLFNINNLSARFFDFAIFQNIILFWILINHGRKDIRAMENALLILALGSILLAVFYNAGIGVESVEVYGVTRLTLFGDNSNITSIRMVISILIIIAAVVQDRLRIGLYRFLLLIPIIIMINLMAETGSRVGFISLALAFIVGILFYKAKNNWNKLFVIIAGSLLFSFFLTIILKSEMLVLRLVKTVVDSDLAGRDEVWVEIINIVQNNLIFGIGQTGYFSIFGLASPHNVFIEVLIYTGIVGLFLYLVFILRISIYAYKCIKIKGKILPLLLMSPIFGILLSGQILNMKLGWLVLAYIISVHLNEFSLSLPQEKKGV